MPKVTLPVLSNVPQITFVSIIDILLVAILIYQLVLIVRGRRAAPVLFGIGLLGVVYVAASALHLELLRTVLATLAPYTAFALIVMFQSELRRALSRLGRRTRLLNMAGQFENRDTIQDLVLAVSELAPNRIGALIVLERDIGLRTFIESGLKMDACVSRDLLLAIFHKTTALHDGAVIMRRDRVAAAGCFLPLTMNPQSRSLGTRHRAAIGITEEADCIAVVVSEETGRISIAAYGKLEPDVSLERLQDRLVDHAKHREAEPVEYGEGAEAETLIQSEAPRGR